MLCRSVGTQACDSERDVQETLYHLRFMLAAYLIALLILSFGLPYMISSRQSPGTDQSGPAGMRQEELWNHKLF